LIKEKLLGYLNKRKSMWIWLGCSVSRTSWNTKLLREWHKRTIEYWSVDPCWKV